jgi:hypothetical protein
MKKALYTLSLTLCAALTLSSCSKGDYSTGVDYGNMPNPFYDDKGGANQSHGNFTAKINGSDFVASASYAYKQASTGISLIGGMKGTSQAELQGVILYPNSLDAGTYEVGSSLNAVYQAVGAASAVMLSSGSAVITENTGSHVKGTFELHASGLDITEGTFDLEIATPPGM